MKHRPMIYPGATPDDTISLISGVDFCDPLQAELFRNGYVSDTFTLPCTSDIPPIAQERDDGVAETRVQWKGGDFVHLTETTPCVIEKDCGCPEGAEDTCRSVICPRK